MASRLGSRVLRVRGSTFWFTMELAKPTTQPEERCDSIGDQFPEVRILIADSDDVMAGLLEHHFTSFGIDSKRLLSLDNSDSGLTPTDRFDLIVMDARYEGLRPAELTLRVRQLEAFSSVPLIFISQLGSDYEKPTFPTAGRVEFVRKPIREAALRETLSTIFKPQETQPQKEHPVPLNHDPLATSLHLDYRILVAEDNPVNQKITSRILEKKGYSVHLVSNGAQALEALDAMKFDLVLMDCQMPIMDGYEATEKLREKEESTGERMPVIAMTANALKGDREKCLESGMDGYLSKPVKPELLYSVLKEYIVRVGV